MDGKAIPKAAKQNAPNNEMKSSSSGIAAARTTEKKFNGINMSLWIKICTWIKILIKNLIILNCKSMQNYLGGIKGMMPSSLVFSLCKYDADFFQQNQGAITTGFYNTTGSGIVHS